MKRLLIFVVLIVIFGGCSEQQTKRELRVGILDWTGYEPLALADKLNLYGTDAIKIVRLSSVIDTLGAMRNGTIDIAALTLDESLVYAQENPDIRAFLVCDISNGGDAVVAKEGIDNPSQLKGKRIGAEESALSAFILHRFLEKFGLGKDEIKIVPINYDIHSEVFKSNSVDAIITYNPAKDKLVKQGGKVLFDSSQMSGEIIDVLIARESFLKSNDENIQHLVKGWYKALKYMKEHPQESYREMAGFERISPEAFEHSLKGLRIPLREEAISILQNGNKMQEDSDSFIANMRQQGLLHKEITFENFYTTEYLKKQP